jgi:hypothetical protein
MCINKAKIAYKIEHPFEGEITHIRKINPLMMFIMCLWHEEMLRNH